MPILDAGASPSTGYTFNLGTLDLSPYLKVQPEDGFDPFDPGFLEPQFSESPAVDGGVLVLEQRGLKEMVWPLALTDTNKDGLNESRRQIIAELAKADGGAGLRLEFADTGSTASTFFDVVFGRLEPIRHHLRELHNWGDHVLRLWTQPYGHTATQRIVATGVGSGVLIQVAVPTVVQGDVPALLDARITAGNTVPSVGRRVALSVLPHASYTAEFAAASIGDRQAGATLVGLSGAHASQYLALPVSPTGASGVAAMVPLPVPTVYAGRNRVFALARSRLNGGVNLRMFDPFGNAIGPTAVATVQEHFGLLDMGVLTVPAGQVPTSFKLPLLGGGASGNTIVASPGLHVNAVFLLPEDQTVVVNDTAAAASALAGDDFDGPYSELTGQGDDYGNTWRTARSRATQSLNSADGWAGAWLGGAAGNYIDRNVQDCDTHGWFFANTTPSGGKYAVRRDVSASYYIDAAYQHLPSRALSLISVASGATTLHASQALASLASNDIHTLSLRTQGGQAFVNLRRADGATILLAGPSGVTVASIGASHANLSQYGNPGLLADRTGSTDSFTDFAVRSIPSSNLAARDVYRFNAPEGQLTRNPSGLDITAYLDGQVRGVVPQVPAPTSPRIVALVAPVDQGVGNDLVSLDARALERFSFLR